MKTSVPALFKDPNPAHLYSAEPAYYESCWSWTRVKVVPHPSCSPGQASVCYVALGWKTTWSSGPSSRRRQAKKRKNRNLAEMGCHGAGVCYVNDASIIASYANGI